VAAASKRQPGKDSGKALRLRLYVASGAPNSVTAHDNLKLVLEENGVDAELEVLDVFEHPEEAARDGVMVTPMVVRVSPEPAVRMFGTLEGGVARRLLP
jgi:circadian clock protein KaiB